MNTQFKTMIGVGALVLSMVAISPVAAFASNGKNMGKHSVFVRPEINVSQTVDIGPKGNVVLRGSVGSVGTNSVVVKSWGGDWTVSVGTDTKFSSRENAVVKLSDIKVGDVVMVHGAMKPNAGLTVEARQIKDLFIPDRTAVIRGAIAAVSGSSLTVKSGDVSWTVNTTAATKITSKFDIATTLASMKAGDEVMVKGVVVAGSVNTVDASEVKNVSLPLNAASRSGVVSALTGNTFTLVHKANKLETKVVTDAATVVWMQGKTVSMADVKNESKVTVYGAMNADTNVLTATKIMINDGFGKREKDDDKGGRR